jgi:dipeptidyl aminopeptidase/acylaminoacyl peptidase
MTPPDLVAIDLADGHASSRPRSLTELNPTFRSVTLGHVKPITWSLEDGTSGTSGLILPISYRAGERYPLLVMLYNVFKEGEFIYQAGWNTSWPAQAFAARGYAVVLMNVPSKGWTPGNADEAKRSLVDAPVAAVKDVVRELVAQGIADPSRMGILGWSYGGFVVNYMISRFPDMFQAVASGEGGSYNPALYWWNSAAGRAETDSVLGGGPYPRFWSQWQQISPVPCAERIRAPVLMEFKNRNTMALELYTAITTQGGQAELVFYTDETHVFSSPRHRYVSMWRNYDWFNFWLLGIKDAAAAKAGQYRRWDVMKHSLAMRTSQPADANNIAALETCTHRESPIGRKR